MTIKEKKKNVELILTDFYVTVGEYVENGFNIEDVIGLYLDTDKRIEDAIRVEVDNSIPVIRSESCQQQLSFL